MGKILIIGDVHGRQFWKDACLNHKDEFEKIVFLGDYLSPYPDEKISGEKAIEMFSEVLKFKDDNPDKVSLLFGNHDFSYINYNICGCRTDYTNWNKINEIVFNHIESFDLAWETEINGKRYFFSHAGVKKWWFERWVKNELFEWDGEELPPAERFNELFHQVYDEGWDFRSKRTRDFEQAMAVYSNYRGWSALDYGSIVWADIREYGMGPEYDNVLFVCGHTQLGEEPIVREWVMDLDCRKPFVLDTETGKIEEYK